MIIVVGLGNPGESYARTRHNIGWRALDTFRAEHGIPAPEMDKPYQALIARGQVGDTAVWCVYPQTFMNQSGKTVRVLMRECPEARLVVVHDEVALPLGDVKVSYGRGAGGHNGIRSIVSHYGSNDFARVRVGVGPRTWWSGTATPAPHGAALANYVLGKFSLLEGKAVTEACDTATTVLTAVIRDGHEAAMNAYNQR